MSSWSLSARMVSCFAFRGLTTIKEAAEAITIANSSMSTICSFREDPACFLLTLQGSHSGAVRVPTLLCLIPERDGRFLILRASINASASYADQHFQSAVQRDLLAPVERRGSEPTSATNDGADARPFAPSEDAAEQRSGPRANGGVNSARSTSSARLDRSFDVDLLPRPRIVELDQLSVNAGAAPVRHDQSIEAQRHCRVALHSPRRLDAADVSVDASVAVLAPIDDSCTERIAYLRVGAG
jgi:hypothetical protein